MKKIEIARNPNLPEIPKAYDWRSFEVFSKALTGYFERIDAVLRQLIGRVGGASFDFAYAETVSLVDQTLAVANTATQATFSTEVRANGVTAAADSFTCIHSGVYRVEFCARPYNSDAAAQDVSFWLQVGSTDVDNSAVFVALPAGARQLVTSSRTVSLVSDDVVEVWWAASSTNVSLDYTAAIAAPYVRPAVPSVRVEISFVSRTPT